MALPQVNITVVDGSLGIIQPTTANVQAKLGVCSLGTASVAASLLVQSTTGGDGITYTAVATGTGGNQISVTYNAPSGGTTTVAVSGNAITVSPKTGETNTGLQAVIAASGPASALVTAVVTLGGSDLIVARTVANLAGGVTGQVNTIIPCTDPTLTAATLGQGPLTEAVVHSLNVAGGLVYAVPVNPSVAGVANSISHIGTGPTVTVAGAPYDAFNVLLTVKTGGTLGNGTFTYSLDGGVKTSATIVIPAGGSYAIPNTNLTLTFPAGTYVAGDTYSFSCAAPSFNTTDVTNAINALTASPNTWAWLHVVGGSTTASASQTLAAAVDTLMVAQAAAFRYTFAVIEVPTDTDANIKTAYASFSTTRTMVCAATATLVSTVSGNSLPRSSAYPVTARMALVTPSTDLGQVSTGSLPGVTALQRDEGVTPGLDALNFTTLRTIVGMPGFFITKGHMFAAPGSDFSLVQNRRVMDIACSTTRLGLLQFLNSKLRVNANGTIYGADASKIEAFVGGQLSAALVAPGDASAVSLVVNRNINILSTQQLPVTTRITPYGYASDIEENIGFTNPALQISAAS